MPEEIADWSLTSPQTRLIKIGARVVRHARAITFQLAEVAVSGDLFNRILAAIPRALIWAQDGGDINRSVFYLGLVSFWECFPEAD